VDDAARPSRLVRADARLLVDHGEPDARLSALQLARDGEPDDPAADDDDVEPGPVHAVR
jgi:hypothetical protein